MDCPVQSDGPGGAGEAHMDNREVGLKGIGTRQACTVVCRSPLGQCGCQPPPHHAHDWVKDGYPQITTFSGDATPGKNEVSFEQWYHEVQCIKDHHPEAVV